jgi:hypothetical protein
MTNLRQAAQQEPVAAQEKSCRTYSHRNPSLKVQDNQGACRGCRFYSHYNCATPPAAQRPWQGLTDEDWDHIDNTNGTSQDTFIQGAAWAAARLKERNNGH